MKFEVLIIVICFTFVQTKSEHQIDFSAYFDNDDNSSSINIPHVNGGFYTLTKNEIEEQIFNFTTNYYKPVIVTFYLYTQQNPMNGQLVDKSTLKKSNFNPKNPTRFIVHGWRNDGNTLKGIKDAYLKKRNFNIFMVDWSSAASSINYIYSRIKVPEVGGKIAEFIDFSNQYAKMKFENLYLIGFSLGGHIVGMVGKKVQNGRIHSIFGLDPASVLFTLSNREHRLSDSDAKYVESIHTNIKALGFRYPLGLASFYPNYGDKQPGCPIYDIFISCSHHRVICLFIESLSHSNQFIPRQCKNYLEILLKNCNGDEMEFKMGGEPSNHGFAKGIYYLSTQSKEPYGVGSSHKQNF